jgi:putative membrane protein
MTTAWKVFAGIGGVLHIAFFVLESFLFKRPDVQKRLGITPEEAKAAWIWAFNQGFYNLFLAVGCLGGLALLHTAGFEREGRALVLFACAYMVGAGVVLVASDPKLVAGACVQAVPPLLALVLAYLAHRGSSGG